MFVKKLDSSDCKSSVAEQLCVVLNDMQHIQNKLSPPQLEGAGGSVMVVSVFEELQLEGFFSWIEAEKGLGQRARSQIRDIVESTVITIQVKIHVATEKLAQQVQLWVWSAEVDNHML